MNIVLSGYYGFNNVGDEAILYSIIQALRANDPNVGITVLSNDPTYTEKTYGVKAVNRWKLPEIFKALKSADGLISGGGSLLQDETGPKSIPYYTGIMKIAQVLGKPVFVYAQGMGPIHKPFNQKIVKSVLKNTQVTVRDVASKKLLEDIGLNHSIKIVPDPVMGLTRKDTSSRWWTEQAFSGPVVSVSVRDWPSSVDYKKKMAEALDLLAKEGNTIVFVPAHGEHDDKTSKEVAGMMSANSYVSPYDDSIEQKINIIGQSNLLVGMRLHALIFSAITVTPFVALSYDPKIDAFAEISGQQVAGHVNEDNWSAQELYEDAKRVLANEEAEKKRLEDKIRPLQKQAAETARDAVEYFKK
jgi:polysaccharide pyruvyl transferase CsaB